LEQIDISLAGKHDDLYLGLQSKISQAAIVPILDSIISSDGCSLKHILFPHKWMGIGTHNASGERHPIIGLRTRFNQYMHSRTSLDLDCSKCDGRMTNTQEWLSGWYENTMICYECLKPTCNDCAGIHERAASCWHCRKKYCTDCVPITECTSCYHKYCEGCGDMKECDECGNALCKDCLYTCGGCNRTRCENCVEMYQCEGCTEKHCEECYNGKEYSIKYCEECGNNYCSTCKFNGLKSRGTVRCRACAGDVAHLILEEMDKLCKKNEELGKENEELKRKVEDRA